MRKIPKRTCIGCKQQKEKGDLIRVVRNKQGEITIDKIGKVSGRGAYICDNKECLERAIKSKGLEKSFEIKIEEDVYESLRGVIIEQS